MKKEVSMIELEESIKAEIKELMLSEWDLLSCWNWSLNSQPLNSSLLSEKSIDTSISDDCGRNLNNQIVILKDNLINCTKQMIELQSLIVELQKNITKLTKKMTTSNDNLKKNIIYSKTSKPLDVEKFNEEFFF